ncbi:nuclear transport factor 2 family protein [Mycobacterium sp. NPDC051198]
MTAPLSAADRLELSDLAHRYAACVDARNFDDLVGLFTLTAQLTIPKPPDDLGPCVRHEGHAGVRTAMESLRGVTRTLHAIVGEVYTAGPAADTATGAVVGVAHHWIDKDGKITDLVWYLRYADEYLRTTAGWRIAKRELTIDAIETRPARQVRL